MRKERRENMQQQEYIYELAQEVYVRIQFPIKTVHKKLLSNELRGI